MLVPILILVVICFLLLVVGSLETLNMHIFDLVKALRKITGGDDEKLDTDAKTHYTKRMEKSNDLLEELKNRGHFETGGWGTGGNNPPTGGSSISEISRCKEGELKAKFKVGEVVKHKALDRKFVIVEVHEPYSTYGYHDKPEPFHRYSVSPAGTLGLEQHVAEPALELVTKEIL